MRHCSQFWTCSTESEEVISSLSVFCRPTQCGQVSSGRVVLPSGWKSWILRPHSMSSMPLRVASARPGSQNKQPSAVSAACSWLFRRIWAVMFSTAQPQSGLATSARCWSGFMKPREELHVFASSSRRITEDPGGSSPTFPTCWLDCRRLAVSAAH